MRLALRACVAASALMYAVGVACALQSDKIWLDDTEINATFKNVTIDGRYASGRSFNESYKDDGTLAYTEGDTSLSGHWSVTQGTLCTIYDQQATGGCYRVTRVSPNCFEFYFVSRTEEAAPGPSGTIPHWTARGAVQGHANACKDQPSV